MSRRMRINCGRWVPCTRSRVVTNRMRLQAAYDLKKAAQNKKVMARVARIVPVNPVKEVRA